MKKVLLGLGTVAVAVAPIATVVACGGSGVKDVHTTKKVVKKPTAGTAQGVGSLPKIKPVIKPATINNVDVNSGISFQLPASFSDKGRPITLTVKENQGGIYGVDSNGDIKVFSLKEFDSFVAFVGAANKGVVAYGKDGAKFNKVDLELTFKAMETSPGWKKTLFDMFALVPKEHYPGYIGGRAIKRNFVKANENIFTYILSKGANFDISNFETKMKGMFNGIDSGDVVTKWDKTLDPKVSGVYTFSLDATKGNDRTKVEYRIRVYDQNHDQGIVLEEAFKRLEELMMDNKKSPFSLVNKKFDEYYTKNNISAVRDRVRFNFALNSMTGSTNLFLDHYTHVKTITDVRSAFNAKNWGIGYKNIALLLYIVHGVNITNIPDAQFDLMKAAAERKEIDPIDQSEVDGWMDGHGPRHSLATGPWKDSENIGPFKMLEKFSDLVKKISSENYTPPELLIKTWKPHAKSGLVDTNMVINILRNPSSLQIIKPGDTIKFERDGWTPSHSKLTNIFDSPTSNLIKEFQIFA